MIYKKKNTSGQIILFQEIERSYSTVLTFFKAFVLILDCLKTAYLSLFICLHEPDLQPFNVNLAWENRETQKTKMTEMKRSYCVTGNWGVWSDTNAFATDLQEHSLYFCAAASSFNSQPIWSAVFDDDALRLSLLCPRWFLSPICSGWQTRLAGGLLLNMYSKRGELPGQWINWKSCLAVT